MANIECTYLDHMGSDLTVVNSAKVSFNKESKWILEQLEVDQEPSKFLSVGDKRLINFLARGCTQDEWNTIKKSIVQEVLDNYHNYQDENILDTYLESVLLKVKKMPIHFTPFTHEIIQLRETVPIFTARQRFKHMIGFTYNEISRRYVDSEPEFYVPEFWRGRAENKKQGSDYNKEVVHLDFGRTQRYYIEVDGKLNGYFNIKDEYNDFIEHSLELYDSMLRSGVAPEQARMVLPQSMMTSYYVTGSLYAFARAYNQRFDRNHAQGEIADLADKWNEIIAPLYPVSWKALTNS